MQIWIDEESISIETLGDSDVLGHQNSESECGIHQLQALFETPNFVEAALQPL